MNNTFRGHLVNHVTWRVTTRLARRSSKRWSRNQLCQYQVTTNAFIISSKAHPQPDRHQRAGWSGPRGVNNKQAGYRYQEPTTVDIAAEYTVSSKFPHTLNSRRVPTLVHTLLQQLHRRTRASSQPTRHSFSPSTNCGANTVPSHWSRASLASAIMRALGGVVGARNGKKEIIDYSLRLFTTIIYNDSLVSPRLVIRVYALTRNRED
jgi:hypothetical protein